MARRVFKSTITEHPDRARIERDLALGRPLARIAKKYGVSVAAAFRHKRKLPPQLKAALAAHALRPAEDLEKLRIEESEGLLGHLAAQRARLLNLAGRRAVRRAAVHPQLKKEARNLEPKIEP